MTNYERTQDYLIKNQFTWVITGAAGFVGSNLLEKLLCLNQKVIGLDNFETGHQKNLDQAIHDANEKTGKSLDHNFTFINGCITNLDTCRDVCNGVDYVLHQAALGSVPRSIKDPINTNKANIDGFLNMLIASKDAKVKRFVYAASSSTYGDNPDLPKVESRIGNPLSPYAVTKVVNELYASVFASAYGFKTIGLRYFNVFGKRQDPNGEYAAVIPKWVVSLLNRQEIYINGDGENSRDFCYIDNAVQMNLLAATVDNNDATNQVYNVALSDRVSLNELFSMIEKGLAQRLKGLEKKKPIYKDFRLGDIKHSQASINKAKSLLGYDPEYYISAGMELTLDWYINNSKG